jgi:hypothetical protein
MQMKVRHTRFAIYALAATLTAGCAAEEAEAPLPESIHGMALVESHSGEEAADILVEMHKAEVVPPENYIGH